MIQRILESGVLPPHQAKTRPIFLIAPLTRAMLEKAFEVWASVFLCGPMSAAALSLAAAGRRDGVAVEFVLLGTCQLG